MHRAADKSGERGDDRWQKVRTLNIRNHGVMNI